MKKWNDMTEKDKIRLLLEKVMGCFILEETAKGFTTPDFAKGKQAPTGFHWPIAFWNTDGECWAYRDIGDNGVTFFDPLHDLNDAWKIVEKLRGIENFDNFEVSWQKRYDQDLPRVVFTFHTPKSVTSHWKHYEQSAPTLAEAICKAAYLFVEEA